MIADLLALYPEQLRNPFGPTMPVTHAVLKSYVIDGHEVAWMSLSWNDPAPAEGAAPDARLSVHRLCCECDFTQGIGWEMEDGQCFTLGEPIQCPHRATALARRHRLLRDDCMEQFRTEDLTPHLKTIAMHLVAMAQNGEFLEDGNGAWVWGGYYYVQTLASVANVSMAAAWEAIRELLAEKRICVHGAVVRPYTEPPPPAYEEAFRVTTDDGWVGVAEMPAHERMDRAWRLRALRPDGSEADRQTLPMTYAPMFGPDVGDLAAAEGAVRDMLAKAALEPANGPTPAPAPEKQEP